MTYMNKDINQILQKKKDGLDRSVSNKRLTYYLQNNKNVIW